MKKRFPLTIEKIALGGFGIGYADGKAVFVPYTAIGDEIEAELVRERKDMSFARVNRRISRGPGTIAPNCEAFGGKTPCGGCDWLDLEYRVQLEYKTRLVRELLQPLKPDLDIPPVIASPETTHYRNKAFMPVGMRNGALTCGIFSRWSHHIVTHKQCQLHQPVFDDIARRCLELFAKAGVTAYDESRHTGTVRHLGFRCSADLGQVMLVLVTRSGKLPFSQLLVKQLCEEYPQISGIVQNINRERGNIILGPEEKLLWGEPYILDRLCNKEFRIHYRSFWQVNKSVPALIVDAMGAHLAENDNVLDCYAGIGALGLSLSNSVAQVLCLEDNASAASDGEANMLRNGIANAGFLCAKVEDALPALLASPPQTWESPPTAIILDPPRSGVQPSVLQAVLNSGINKVIYLSCSPITLRRDLKVLLDSGKYNLRHLQAFDMFPQTWHTETLTVLELL